jgi:GntR family transcriptional regulator
MAVARHRSTIPLELAARIGLTREAASAPGFSLYRHYEEHGLSVASATERLIACPASAEDRKLLRLPDRAVVVSVTRHSFAADGTALDAVAAIYDARRYSYEARLVRQHHFGNTQTGKDQHNDQTIGDLGSHYGPRLGPWGN